MLRTGFGRRPEVLWRGDTRRRLLQDVDWSNSREGERAGQERNRGGERDAKEKREWQSATTLSYFPSVADAGWAGQAPVPAASSAGDCRLAEGPPRLPGIRPIQYPLALGPRLSRLTSRIRQVAPSSSLRVLVPRCVPRLRLRISMPRLPRVINYSALLLSNLTTSST